MPGKYKNVERKHFFAEYVGNESKAPADEMYFPLERYISNIEPSPEYDTEEVAWYHGDGTPEKEIKSIVKAYNVEGARYYGDEAQDLVASKEGKLGAESKVWHKIIRADGKKQYEGVATLTDIVVDGGEASDDEAFGCTVSYDQFPEVTDVPPVA